MNNKGISLVILIIIITLIIAVVGAVILTIVNSNPISQTNYKSAIKKLERAKDKVDNILSEIDLSNEEKLYKILDNNNVNAQDDGIKDTLLEEIGMYRNWYYTNSVPDITKSYKTDLVNTPNGIKNLYYVEKKSGIKEREYIYDMVTGIIYVKRGVEYDRKIGYCIYSIEGIKYGNILGKTPNFNNTEIADNSKDKLKYTIVSDKTDLLFKHYENGDVYGVGKKGSELNTSTNEIKDLEINKWKEFVVPSVIGKYKKIISTVDNIYIIDNNDDLWGWGNNTNNKFGINKEQLNEYSNKSPIKLNINGKKVKDVYDYCGLNTFVVTTDNEVYGCGNNKSYNFGLGNNSDISEFIKIDISNVENIKEIQNGKNGTLVIYKDNKYYYSGYNNFGINNEVNITKFIQIWDQITDIKEVVYGDAIRIIKNDGTLWQIGDTSVDLSGSTGSDSLNNGDSKVFRTFQNEIGTNVEKIYSMNSSNYILRKNIDNKDEILVAPGSNLTSGVQLLPADNKNVYYKITIPDELYNIGIKNIYESINNTYYLANDGTIWGNGLSLGLGLDTTDNVNTIKKLGFKSVDFDYINHGFKVPLIKHSNDKLYIIGNDIYMNHDKDIQNIWKKVASNVKKFIPGAYIDSKDNLWVSGIDARFLGLNTVDKKEVSQYTKNNDSRFNSTVKDIKRITNNSVLQNLFIITTDNKLYSTGAYNLDSGILGNDNKANQYAFESILQNVRLFDGTYKFVGTLTDNNLYGWGKNGDSHVNTGFSETPKLIELPNELLSRDIKSIKVDYSSSFIITNMGELWSTGNVYTGVGNVSSFTKHNQANFNNEKIIKFEIGNVGENRYSRYALTDKGNVYVWGHDSKIVDISNITNTPVKASISDVVDIVCGNGFVIAIKNNGEVWGVGDNTNGIFGRWIDKEGKYSKSNNESAYEWVRCPTLEE